MCPHEKRTNYSWHSKNILRFLIWNIQCDWLPMGKRIKEKRRKNGRIETSIQCCLSYCNAYIQTQKIIWIHHIVSETRISFKVLDSENYSDDHENDNNPITRTHSITNAHRYTNTHTHTWRWKENAWKEEVSGSQLLLKY